MSQAEKRNTKVKGKQSLISSVHVIQSLEFVERSFFLDVMKVSLLDLVLMCIVETIKCTFAMQSESHMYTKVNL